MSIFLTLVQMILVGLLLTFMHMVLFLVHFRAETSVCGPAIATYLLSLFSGPCWCPSEGKGVSDFE